MSSVKNRLWVNIDFTEIMLLLDKELKEEIAKWAKRLLRKPNCFVKTTREML